MNGYEIKQELEQSDKREQCFIKWWRQQSEFADYQLVSDFLDSLQPEHQFEGYKLLTKQEMWEELQRRVPDRVALESEQNETVILWQREDAKGEQKELRCPYSAESIMQIFDVETHGDTHI